MTSYGVTPGVDRIRGVRVQRLAKDVGVGLTLEGTTSLGIKVGHALDDLPALAKRLVALGLDLAFQDEWPHVDDLIEVEDEEERLELDQALIDRLSRGSTEDIHLGLPDDADGYAGVRYGASQQVHEDFDLTTALKGWRGGLPSLKSRRVEFVFDDDRVPCEATLYDLLVATEPLDGEEVYLADGEWFRVKAGLLEVVDDYLDDLPDWDVDLPPWMSGKDEGGFLKGVAKDRADLLLMDRKNVIIGGGTAMEVCDLAHDSGAMVHVKKLDAKGLTHLAAQVQGSAGRWATQVDYRRAVLEKMRQQAKATEKDMARFEPQFQTKYPQNGTHPQVLAIGAPWAGRTMSEAVSTLAKLQLYRAVVDLRGKGYDIQLARVDRPKPE
jgi:uncharacterized protein (TIGR04141 family)